MLERFQNPIVAKREAKKFEMLFPQDKRARSRSIMGYEQSMQILITFQKDL